MKVPKNYKSKQILLGPLRAHPLCPDKQCNLTPGQTGYLQASRERADAHLSHSSLVIVLLLLDRQAAGSERAFVDAPVVAVHAQQRQLAIWPSFRTKFLWQTVSFRFYSQDSPWTTHSHASRGLPLSHRRSEGNRVSAHAEKTPSLNKSSLDPIPPFADARYAQIDNKYSYISSQVPTGEQGTCRCALVVTPLTCRRSLDCQVVAALGTCLFMRTLSGYVIHHFRISIASSLVVVPLTRLPGVPTTPMATLQTNKLKLSK